MNSNSCKKCIFYSLHSTNFNIGMCTIFDTLAILAKPNKCKNMYFLSKYYTRDVCVPTGMRQYNICGSNCRPKS